MTGIYKIENKINGKVYIGQAKNIFARLNEHYLEACREDDNSAIHKAIRKYGIENFSFEIMEVCEPCKLDEEEIYFIKMFGSFGEDGYNLTPGGDGIQMSGEENPNSKMTKEDVFDIRERYSKIERKRDVYSVYKDKISINTFADIWTGKTWKEIHCDVYTEENKKKQRNNFDRKTKTRVSKEDIVEIRNMKNSLHSRKEVQMMFSDKMSKFVFDDIWFYRTFKNIMPTVDAVKGKRHRSSDYQEGTKNRMAKLTEQDVRAIRAKKESGEDLKECYEPYRNVFHIASFRKVWFGETYKNVK